MEDLVICSRCQTENIADAIFCKKCGKRIKDDSPAKVKTKVTDTSHSVLIESKPVRTLPFHLQHPELHLKPISEFDKLFFWFNKPEYVEDPSESEKPEYLYIAREGKIGILYWHFEEHWYGDTNDFHRVIQCEYDRIEKKEDMFVCYKGSERVFIDLKGNILK